MSVVEAKIQTVEDMYRLIWTAIANKQPISAVYKDHYRLFCPHRLGHNRLGEPRVLCYQHGGAAEVVPVSLAAWPAMAVSLVPIPSSNFAPQRRIADQVQ